MSSEGLHKSAEVDRETVPHALPPLWRLVLRRMSAIATLSKGGNSAPFYCVHPIGGDVTKFYDLARLLGPEQRFYGIQVPKEKMTDAFGASIKAIARHYVETLVAFQPEGTIVLGGWSVGAIIALEMAQQLRAIGRNVPLLVALDGAPCNTGGGINPWNPRYGWKLICNLPSWIKDDQRQNWSLSAFTRRVAAKLAFRTLVGMPTFIRQQTLHDEAVRDLMDNTGWLSGQRSFIRALYAAARDYIPEPYAGRVIVYEARIQPLWHLLQVGAAWTKIVRHIEIVIVDGSHTNLLEEPAVGVLAAHLRVQLAALWAATEASGTL